METGSNSKIQLLVWFSQLMGGLCSRSAEVDRVFANSDADSDASHKPNTNNNSTDFTTPPQVREIMDRNPAGLTADDVFYDGIPRYAAKVL